MNDFTRMAERLAEPVGLRQVRAWLAGYSGGPVSGYEYCDALAAAYGISRLQIGLMNFTECLRHLSIEAHDHGRRGWIVPLPGAVDADRFKIAVTNMGREMAQLPSGEFVTRSRLAALKRSGL